jgi:ribonuclease-3
METNGLRANDFHTPPLGAELFWFEETGPDHAREFTFGVRIQGQVYGRGKGVRKQEATKAAAIAALEKIYG